MSSIVPLKLVSGSRPSIKIFQDGGQLSWGSEAGVTSASTNKGSGAAVTPTDIMEPGNVLGKGNDGKFYANSGSTKASVLPSAPAAVQSKINIAAWNTGSKTFKWQSNGGPEQTVTGATADTATQMASDLNANAGFAADFIATVQTSKITITARRVGVTLTITGGTVNSQGGSPDDTFTSNNDTLSTDGDYVVLVDYVDQRDANGVDSDLVGIPVVRRGYFYTANIIGLNGDARRILEKRASIFT